MLKNHINLGENPVVVPKKDGNYALQNLKINIDNFRASKAFDHITEMQHLKDKFRYL